jgi:hypothetical protein
VRLRGEILEQFSSIKITVDRILQLHKAPFTTKLSTCSASKCKKIRIPVIQGRVVLKQCLDEQNIVRWEHHTQVYLSRETVILFSLALQTKRTLSTGEQCKLNV